VKGGGERGVGRGLYFSLWVSLSLPPSLSPSLSLSVGLSLSLSGCVSLWGGFRAYPCYFPRDVSLGPFPPSPLSTRAGRVGACAVALVLAVCLYVSARFSTRDREVASERESESESESERDRLWEGENFI
jgi:hypothetical protein